MLDTPLGGTVLYPPVKWLRAETNGTSQNSSLSLWEGVLVLQAEKLRWLTKVREKGKCYNIFGRVCVTVYWLDGLHLAGSYSALHRQGGEPLCLYMVLTFNGLEGSTRSRLWQHQQSMVSHQNKR